MRERHFVENLEKLDRGCFTLEHHSEQKCKDHDPCKSVFVENLQTHNARAHFGVKMRRCYTRVCEDATHKWQFSVEK